MFICLREYLFEHVLKLSTRSQTNKSHLLLRYMLIATCIYMVFMASVIIAYEVIKREFDVPIEWYINLTRACGNVGLFGFTTASFI